MLTRVVTHPVLMAVAGLMVIEYYQGHDEVSTKPVFKSPGVIVYEPAIKRVAGGGWLGSVAGTTIEGGLVAYLAAESLKEGFGAIAALK